MARGLSNPASQLGEAGIAGDRDSAGLVLGYHEDSWAAEGPAFPALWDVGHFQLANLSTRKGASINKKGGLHQQERGPPSTRKGASMDLCILQKIGHKDLDTFRPTKGFEFTKQSGRQDGY